MSPTSQPPVVQPGLRERKKARTKATIQREALRLFSEQGYAETSVEQIAAAAEVSPSTFFRYFPTKEEVVLADFIDERLIQRLREAPTHLDPTMALRHAMSALDEVIGPEEMELEKLRNELISQVPELRKGMVLELLRPMQLLAEALAERLGRARDDEDVRIFAGAMIGGLITAASPDQMSMPSDTGAVRARILERLDRLAPMLRFPGTSEH